LKLSPNSKIGPHNLDIISIIVGSLMGDTHLEKRKNGIGTRIIFEQSNKNVEYLMWFHSYLSIRGYCNPNKPKLHKRIKKNGEILFHYRINSYTYSSFN
jgi:ubiquinol-cytochrome c reductase cytochrome b subunit